MCPRMLCGFQNSAAIAAACLALLLIITPTADAQNGDGMKSDDGHFPLTPGQVAEFQEMLQRLHFDPGTADGIVGPKTVSAAKALTELLERQVLRRPSGRKVVLNCEIEEGTTKGNQSRSWWMSSEE